MSMAEDTELLFCYSCSIDRAPEHDARPFQADDYLPEFRPDCDVAFPMALCAAADCALAAKLPLLTCPPWARAVALWMREAAARLIDLPLLRLVKPDLLILILSFFLKGTMP